MRCVGCHGGSLIIDGTNRANSYLGVEADFDFTSKPFKQKDAFSVVDQALLERIEGD